MKTEFDKLREKITEAQKEIKNEKSEVSYVFNRALKSVLLTMDEIENQYEVGEYYFFYDDFKIQDGFIYGKLIEIDKRKENFLRYCVQLPYGTITYWYSAISKELPINLLNHLNN
jgi:hypothetical protein